MICRTVSKEGFTAIVCGSGRRQKMQQWCLWCRSPMKKLCDFPVRKGETCNASMCEAHAHQVGPNLDFCPNHAGKRPAL